MMCDVDTGQNTDYFLRLCLLLGRPAGYDWHTRLWIYESLVGELEQLERLRSEDTPRRLMITHTMESYWIPSQKKTKSKLQI